MYHNRLLGLALALAQAKRRTVASFDPVSIIFSRCGGYKHLLAHIFINTNVVWVAILSVHYGEDVNRFSEVGLGFAVD